MLVVVAVSVWFLEYRTGEEKRAFETRVHTLERQVAYLSDILQESGIADIEDRLDEIAGQSAGTTQSQEDLLTGAVARAAPAVVSIVVSKDVPLLEVEYVNPFGDDPYFRDFGVRVPVYRQIGTQPQQIGAGTGFFVRSDGYIITNKHVIADPEATYVTLLADGTQRTARLVYADESHDIAVLKVDGTGYPTIALGDSASLRLGQTVAAIGNALGEYSNSVSVGIISGLNRTIDATDSAGRVQRLTGVIQTDAAINRGNSGGPLLDLSGNAVGVSVATRLGAQNIAFAVPIDVVRTIIARAVR